MKTQTPPSKPENRERVKDPTTGEGTHSESSVYLGCHIQGCRDPPQGKLKETHALLPSSEPQGSRVPPVPMARASSGLWYAPAETQECPHLLPIRLFPRTALPTALSSLPFSSISGQPVIPQTSQVRIIQTVIFKCPMLLGAPPQPSGISSHTDFKRVELQHVGIPSVTANENGTGN